MTAQANANGTGTFGTGSGMSPQEIMDMVTGLIGDVIPAIGEIASADTSADGEVTVTTTTGDTYVATGGTNDSVDLTQTGWASELRGLGGLALPLGLVALAAFTLWR